MLYSTNLFAGKPKRTKIGDGRRVRTTTGRTKRSPHKKPYRGQGKR